MSSPVVLNTWRFIFATLCIVLIALIIWASLEKSVIEIFRVMFAERWGIVTLLDLYGGFLVACIWISVLERRVMRILPWIAAMMLLGNLATAAYVLWRLRNARSLTQAFTQIAPSSRRDARS